MLGRLLVARYGIRHFGGEVIEDLFNGRRLLPSLERFDEIVGKVAVLDGVALPGALVGLARGDDETSLPGKEQPGRLLIDAHSIDHERLFAVLRRLSAEARIEEQDLSP